MIQWTHAATAKLDAYFVRVRKTLDASGADADEVIDDLRRHLAEEAAALRLTVMTEEDVQRILARIGAPEPVDVAPDAKPFASSAESGEAKPAKKRPGWILLILGVVLPVITIGFEFLTGGCAAILFDPLPNWGSILLVAFVPLANLLIWRAARCGDLRRRTTLGWANGVAFGVALVYGLMFLPLVPFAAIGVVYFGLGLIPLTPPLALLAVLLLRRRLRQAGGDAAPLPGLWLGGALGVAGLVLCSLPMVLTETGMGMAVAEDSVRSARSVRLLRVFGTEERMLRFCYGRAGWAAGMYSWGKPVSPEGARGVYYRVTGRAFNSVPPPKLYSGRARWNVLEEEFTWDADQAGDTVAGRVKGLSLVSSRQDGLVEGDAALSYLEWTLEFKNDSALQREARAQIALPPGGVVSRLTLWIDGEEREAAFGGRSQVKAAYKEVVQRRRDPVLVTTCGPDRVLMQCFPVPPNGGRMKVRVGVTAPLVLTNAGAGFVRWPCFLERNFTVAPDFRHSLWLESKQPLAPVGQRLTGEQSKGTYAVRGQVFDVELASAASAVRCQRDGQVRQVWTADTRGSTGQIVRQTLTETTVPPPERVVVVVDGTRGMEPFCSAIAEAIGQLPEGIEFAVLLASDGWQELSGPGRKADAALVRQAASRLSAVTFAGGHDNVPALARAWDLASEKETGAIVWIHGPQPVLFDTGEELRQRFERRPGHPQLLEIQTLPGPNRVAEKLDGLGAVQSAPRLGELREDLQRLFGGWRGGTKRIERVLDRIKAETLPVAGEGKEVSSHLARLWAVEEVGRFRVARRTADAAELAARYQLVTPVSGAVVLETQQQYARAGLQPADATQVPAVPEPSTWVLIGVGLLLCGRPLLRQRRAGSRQQTR